MPSRAIRSFQLKNYKSFEETREINIQGLTILLGPNSSGKSNILESLLLLKQSIESKDFGGLVLNGDIVTLGEYKDIIHKKQEDQSLGYRFNFEEEHEEAENQGKEYSCPLCDRHYTYEGYYTNHLEDVHPGFYQNGEVDLKLYEEFNNRDPYVEFSYKLDSESRSIILEEFVYGNPPPFDGLFLSTFEFVRCDDGTHLKGYDIHGREALDFILQKPGEYEDTRINNLSELSDYYLSAFREVRDKVHQSKEIQEHFEENILHDKGEPQDYSRLGEIDHNYNSIFSFIYSSNQTDAETPKSHNSTFIGLINRLERVTQHQEYIINDIQDFLDPMSHLGPLRENPERIYFGASGDPETVGKKGQNIPNILFKDKQARGSDLTERTNQWLQESGFDCQIDISEVGVGDLYQLEVIEDGLAINLADTGFGLSQILPIIIECIRLDIKKANESSGPPWRALRGPNGRIIWGARSSGTYLNLIEQPEIHLNPQMHADVSDFFIETTDSGISLLVETHSEHMLTRIQRRVADGTIDSRDDVTIYFISKKNQVSQIEEIAISETGEFNNWPDGFFEEDFEEAMAMLRESMGNQIE